MKLNVSEVEFGVGIKKDKDIQIRLTGEDIKFVVTEYSVGLFIDEDIADGLVFHLGTILQDRERRKKELTKG